MMPDNEQNAQDMFDDSDLDGESPAQIELPDHVVQNKELLEEVDPEKKLRIWQNCHSTEDVLVREYIDLLDKTKFLPEPPTPEELVTVSAVSPVLTSSKEAQVKVINIFSAFLSNTYHLDNVTEACNRDLPLFVPKAKFLVPNYSHLPLSYFDNLLELKKNFACAIQLESISAVKFTNELFLLKAFYQLQVDLKTVISDHVKSEYCALFSIACDNFKKEHKGKTIDWDNKPSHIHGSLPGWRKNKKAPPAVVHNRYAEKISKAILGNKIDLSGSNAHRDLRTFLERPSNPVPSSVVHAQQPHPPPQPPPSAKPQDNQDNSRNKRAGGSRLDRRQGVTDYDRLFPKRKHERKKNQRVMANRGLNDNNHQPPGNNTSISD